MAEEDAVLFANEAFYRAFADRDMAAMDGVWAVDAPVACIHPGWNALAGRDKVMASWRSILAAGGAPDIRCRGAQASIFGGVAFVICYEQIGGEFLVATNVFVRQEVRWKMVHHQAGPTGRPTLEQDGDGDVIH